MVKLTIENAEKYTLKTIPNCQIISSHKGLYNCAMMEDVDGIEAVKIKFKLGENVESFLVWIEDGSLYGEW